jgi:hypothetical protein
MTHFAELRPARSTSAVILCACACLAACGSQSTEESVATTHQALFGAKTGVRVAAATSDAGARVTLSGTVMDPTGIPLQGVTVTLTGGAQGDVVTDFTGTYTFSVKPGSYSLGVGGVCASFEPSVDNLNNVTTNKLVDFVGSGGQCPPAPSSGGTSGSITISGQVTAAGKPVPGAKVTLSGGTDGFRTADETGAYSFSVNPGSYSLSTSGGCASFTPGVTNLNHITKSTTENFAGTGSCPPPPLMLCPTFDTLFGESEAPACATITTDACSDRIFSWVSDVVFDFAIAASSDCRFGQWVPPLFPVDASTDYLNELEPFTLQLFGCAFQGMLIGPIADGLVPPFFLGHTFTTADLNALSSLYVGAIQQSLSDSGLPPLTSAQLSAINSQLAYAQSKVPDTVSSTKFTFSTCGDAGH